MQNGELVVTTQTSTAEATKQTRQTEALAQTQASSSTLADARTSAKFRVLMCRPTYFTVSYQINPWMDASRPVDTQLAVDQWQSLVDAYTEAGHKVELIDPLAGMPDMIFAANGATIVGNLVYEAKFAFAQRAPEGPAYLQWFADNGFETREAEHTNEGQGDFLTVGKRILAGTGFRTDVRAHQELNAFTGAEVTTLQLVDDRFYHIDTALTVLDARPGAENVAYYPAAFDDASQVILKDLYPDAIIAEDHEAEVLGLNAFSDGRRVFMTPAAPTLAEKYAAAGFEPVLIDTSEILRAGGGIKCCTLVLSQTE